MNIDIERLDDGDGIEATMMKHHASWHKTCRLKFNETKLQRLQNKSTDEGKASASSAMLTRSSLGKVDLKDALCFLCDEPAGSEGLHEASTYDIDMKVRRCAMELEDTALLAKLAPGDMIALEAKYHCKCLLKLYNRTRVATATVAVENVDLHLHGIAFAELVSYMEDYRMEEDVAPVFKLAELAQMYKTRLQQLGAAVEGRIHTTRLKIRLLSVFPDLIAHSQGQGKDVLLIFDNDIGSALRKACDYDNDALHLTRAARFVRREMFEKRFSFDGSFKQGCQKDSVPQSLLALVNMILEGPNIKHQTQNVTTASTTASLSIAQLLMFNSVKHARTADFSDTVRHNRERETPLPLYIALKIHTVTRSRTLIDTLFNLGMCISYDRLLKLTSDIANGVCQRFTMDGVVCPHKMRTGLFTTAAVDNIDYNPSSATAKDSFHGTGISLMQHPSPQFSGLDRGVLIINQTTSSTSLVAPLPSNYTCVLPAELRTKQFSIPPVNSSVRPLDLHILNSAKEEESEWLNTVMAALKKQQLDRIDWVSWSAYHASIQEKVIPPAAINGMLPLFLDNAHSVAMIKHSMIIVQAAVQHLNPGQIPVLAADQPLYAIAKQIQWASPTTLGEDHFVVMFGGLHIEMAILKVLGDWLEDSGWTSALVQADIASSGTAGSFIKASHVTKTRHAHQITVASVHTLLHQAYDKYKSEAIVLETEHEILPLEHWCEKRAQQSVQFDYWLKTLSLEIVLLLYVRAIREGNFQLYIESLTKIVPWMFALDHTHYSRWLPIHIRDLMLLSVKHPTILTEFNLGRFVVHKTMNKFSAMAIDQCHEQNNAIIKDSGGAVGLTSNPGALRRWMIAGPEVARMVIEFEEVCTQDIDQHHHEQYPKVQAAFLKDVRSLVTVIEEMGNPFLEESQDLLVLDTRDIMDASVVEIVRKIEALGEEQYNKFVEERLIQSTKPIMEPLHKNKLALFSCPSVKSLPSKQKMQVKSLKNDCPLLTFVCILSNQRWRFLLMKTRLVHHHYHREANLGLAQNLTFSSTLVWRKIEQQTPLLSALKSWMVLLLSRYSNQG